jgi:hypothetical protein
VRRFDTEQCKKDSITKKCSGWRGTLFPFFFLLIGPPPLIFTLGKDGGSTMNESIKEEVLKQMSGNRPFREARGHGPSKWSIEGKIVHMRFCSKPMPDGATFGYNINPNTLSSDYEVWICGRSEVYYLIPIAVIKKIYADPGAYVDSTHPEMRVAHIHTGTHRATFSTRGSGLDFAAYFRAILPPNQGKRA